MATHTHIAKEAGVKVALIDSVIEAMTTIVNTGEKLTLKGIGSFVRKDKAERQGRNPATEEAITIPAKNVITFKAQKDTAIVKETKKAKKK